MNKEQIKNIWKISIICSIVMFPISYLMYRDLSFSLRYLGFALVQGLLISWLVYKNYNRIAAKTPKKEKKHLGFIYMINKGIERAKLKKLKVL